jgi:DNA polymerase III subunit alpha
MTGIPLHNHSEYSTIDGISTAEEIAQRVIVEMGCPCCGITDHGVVAGHLKFDKAIRKAGGKPIFGCELYHGLHFGQKKPKRDQAHLIALAMTDEGLKNLWRLNDAAAQEPKFHHVGRNSWEDFEKFHEGIVFTSACPAGLVARGILNDDFEDLNHYLDIMGDDFYIELTTYPGDQVFADKDLPEPVRIADLNLAKWRIAQERGIPVVYGDDGHYAYPDQYKYHDAYVAKSTGQSIFTPLEDRKMWHPEGALCIKTEDEVRIALSYLPEKAVDEALANTVAIGERADAHLPEVRRHLPIFIPRESPWVAEGYADDEADRLFLDLIEEGMYKRYGEDPPEEVIEQTTREAEVFLDPEHNLYHYFLLAWDVMQFCDHADTWLQEPDNFKNLQLEREDEIPGNPIERGPGRGSSAGCIVAYELGITDVNPLPYDLIFERFWNPGRAKGFPDIDSDFEKSKRYLIKRYLTWRWGHDRVRSIGTVTRMKPKAVIETMWSACGITYTEAEALKKIVEETPDLDILGVDQIGWSREVDPGKVYYVWEEVGDKIVEWIGKQPANRQEILAQFIDYCEVLCNRASNYGVHPSGIVISDADLPDIAPCRFAGSTEQRIPVTQFPMDDIDALMLIKFDALGLRTLDVLADWKAQMKEYGIDIEWSGLEWEDHKEEMWELMERGFAAGIFQIERGYPKKLAEEFKPKTVSDLSTIVALNRPGPIRSGAPDSFIRRRAGEEEIRYDDPFLEDLLDTTYGWFLYQEAVIRFFGKLGYSDSDADAVRKILGKKQPEKWVALYRGEDEWEGKGYIEMAAKAGIGDISKTQAKEWRGEDVTLADGRLLYAKDAVNAWIIWAKIVDFGKYSFNKSHSVAYATIAFRALFAKYNAPSEFYMACIRNVDKNKKAERIPEFVNEARRWGIAVHPPDIEYSEAQVGVHDGDVYFGFSDVKGVGPESANYLVKLRDEGAPLESPEALFEYMAKLTKERAAENKRLTKEGKPKLAGKSPKQMLQENKISALFTAGAWERLEGDTTPLRDRQEREKEVLSVILSDNTAEAFAENADEIAECDLYEEAKAPYTEDMRFVLPGVVTHIKDTKVKATGKKMGIVTIEYEGDSIEFAVFPDQWRGSKFLWHERTPGIFTIKHSLNKKTGKPGYHFERGIKL